MTPIDGSTFAAPGSWDDAVTHVRSIAASPSEVFLALTDGVEISSWLGVPAVVDLAIGGRYELLFDETQEPGSQGSEGCQILAFVPDSMLAITWNSPPSLPEARGQHTFVVFMLQPEDEHTTVTLAHAGHGHGEIWEENRAYFQRAWGLVLDALARHFD